MKEIGFIKGTIKSKLNISTNTDKIFISNGLTKHLEKRNHQNHQFSYRPKAHHH